MGRWLGQVTERHGARNNRRILASVCVLGSKSQGLGFRAYSLGFRVKESTTSNLLIPYMGTWICCNRVNAYR